MATSQLTDHGQSDACSIWIIWRRWLTCTSLVMPRMYMYKDLNPQPKLVLNSPTPKIWTDESSTKVPGMDVESGPLASEANV